MLVAQPMLGWAEQCHFVTILSTHPQVGRWVVSSRAVPHPAAKEAYRKKAMISWQTSNEVLQYEPGLRRKYIGP
jgi:hypothetical protein